VSEKVKKYRFQLTFQVLFISHVYSNFSCVIFYRDCFLVVLVLLGLGSWNSGFDYKTG